MRRGAAVFILYAVFFGLLFLQFPLKNSFPGNCDSWLVVAISNQYLLFFERLFDPSIGMAMYPVPQIFSYGEASPGCAALFLLCKAIGLNDLWAYYLYLTLIFALTAFAAYRFAEQFMPPLPGALFAGYAFACSNMFFAHIDDSIIYFYFIPLTAARLLWEAMERGSRRRFFAVALLGGAQVYFSLYVFIYQTLLLAAIVLYCWYRREGGVRRTSCLTPYRAFAGAAGLYALMTVPFFGFYLWSKLHLNIIDPFGQYYTAQMTSLMPFDFIAALPENLLYGGLVDLPQNWGFVRHRNLIGLLVVALGLYGMMQWNGRRLLFILIASFGLIFALGPNLIYHPQAKILPPAPLYPFYTWVPILSYLRVTNRAYFLVLFALSLCAGLSFDRLFRRFVEKKRAAAYAAVAAVFIVHGVENIPIPFKAWPVAAYIDIPADYAQFAVATDAGEVFLDLPTAFNMRFEDPDAWRDADPRELVTKRPDRPELRVREMSMFTSSWDNIFQYNREIIYLYWQSRHHRSTISGLNGYFPTPRMIYQYWTARLPDPEAFGELKRYGVTVLVYHKNMGLPRDTMTFQQIDSSPLLEKVFDGPTVAAFRLR